MDGSIDIRSVLLVNDVSEFNLEVINIHCSTDRSVGYGDYFGRRRRDYDERPTSIALDCSAVSCLNRPRPSLPKIEVII